MDVSLEDESLRYETITQANEVYRYNRRIVNL